MKQVKIGLNNYWIKDKDMVFIKDHLIESPSVSGFVSGGLERCLIRMVRERTIINIKKPVTIAIDDSKLAKITKGLPKIVEDVKIAIPEKESGEIPTISYKVVSVIEANRFASKRIELNTSIEMYKNSRVSYYKQKAIVDSMPLKSELIRLDSKIRQLNKPIERIALGKKYSTEELDQLKYFYEEMRKKLVLKVSKEAALIEVALEDDPDYIFESDMLTALEHEKKQARSKVSGLLKWFKQYRLNHNGKPVKTAAVATKDGKTFTANLSFKVSETKIRGY